MIDALLWSNWEPSFYFFLDKKVTKNQGLQRSTLRSTAEPLWPAERNHFVAIQLQRSACVG
jgi:hypothetical protein